jgi:hypothetical protein
MQIHEITRRKKLEEGLLDNIKSAVHSAKTGYQGKGEEGGSGVLGALKALSSNTQSAVSDQFIQQKNAEKMGDQLGARIDKLNDVKADQVLQAWIKDKPEIDKEIQVKLIPPKVTQVNPARVAAQQNQQTTNQQTTNQQTTNQQTTNQAAATVVNKNITNKPTTVGARADLLAAQKRQMSPQSGIKEASARQRRAKARKQQTNNPVLGATTQPNTTQNQSQQDEQSKAQLMQKEFETRLKAWLDGELKVKLDDVITKFQTSDDVEEKNAVSKIKSGLDAAIKSYPNTQSVNSSMTQIIKSVVPLAAKIKGERSGQRNMGSKEVTGGQQLPKTMEKISDDPIIIRHGNKEMGLNEKGQWINLATGKIPPEALNQLYDKAAQFSESKK